jgi:hypothetical protein
MRKPAGQAAAYETSQSPDPNTNGSDKREAKRPIPLVSKASDCRGH